jgi:hypothetical protein
MSINIYWTCLEDEWMRANTPTPVISEFRKNYTDQDLDANFVVCPAFSKSLKNVFALQSLYNYNFEIVNNQITSNSHNLDFAEKHLMVRSIEKKIFSFTQYFTFFTDAKSLEMTVMPPFLEDNFVSSNCKVIPGTFDIAKWYRNIEFSFLLKENINQFNISENDNYLYLKFHTDEKINFIQYRNNDLLVKYRNDVLNSRNFSKLKSLENFYNTFKLKKLILEEIKKNIL